MSIRRASTNPPVPYRFAINFQEHMAETVRLSAEEYGCYVRLLMSYWQSGALPDDDAVLSRVVGMTPKEWAKVRPAVEPFFDSGSGQWIHWRMDEELAKAYEAINANKARTRAATSARKAKAAGRRDNGAAPIHIAGRSPSRKAQVGDFDYDVSAADSDIGMLGAA